MTSGTSAMTTRLWRERWIPRGPIVNVHRYVFLFNVSCGSSHERLENGKTIIARALGRKEGAIVYVNNSYTHIYTWVFRIWVINSSSITGAPNYTRILIVILTIYFVLHSSIRFGYTLASSWLPNDGRVSKSTKWIASMSIYVRWTIAVTITEFLLHSHIHVRNKNVKFFYSHLCRELSMNFPVYI